MKQNIASICIAIALLLGAVSAIRSAKYYKKTGKLNNHPKVFWGLKTPVEKGIDVGTIIFLILGICFIYF